MKRLVLSTIVCLVFALVAFTGATAQSGKTLRVGYLDPSTETAPYFSGLRLGMKWLGYVEGESVIFEARFAQGNMGRLDELAADLVEKNVDMIVTVGGASLEAARKATSSIPIVMGFSGDPVLAGFVESHARPGGNITGLSWFSSELAGKRLELLKQVIPTASRVAVLSNPEHPGEQIDWREAQEAAKKLGLTLDYVTVRKPADFAEAFAKIGQNRPDGLLVIPDALTVVNSKKIADFATQNQLPMIAAWTAYTKAGGLISYGPNLGHQMRRIAVLVDKVAEGVAPAELPVESPVKFDLVVNLETANALEITVPDIIIFQADEVIQ